MGLEKIEVFRKEKGLKQKELAELAGVPIGTFTKIVTGVTKDPSVDTVKAIVNAMGKTLDDLDDIEKNNVIHIEDFNKDCTAKEKQLIKDYRRLDPHGQKAVDITLEHELERCQQESERYIDMIIYNQSAAAGLGNYLSDDNYNFDTLSFAIDEVPNGADFGIKVSGDSMEPIILDGDIAWVKQQLKVENGQIGIFILEGNAYCKKLHVDYKKGVIELISLNKKYDNITINDNSELKTVGRVLL